MRTNHFLGSMKDRQSAWSRTASTLNRWLWGALCCGVPGVPCYFCNCCERLDDGSERERPRVNRESQIDKATATAERVARPHRPHAPCGRKHTPETLSAVRYALNQLQAEPTSKSELKALPEYSRHSPEPC
ncbi:uncharacterized protein LOC110372724 isoform X2 [Helicoverpa armigera]|uniref:uncharacterized protein LOC110372724 isoform X2 n=1 Tax=Helicoverpa armigera TaxID=29058 RepID=UPI000B3ABEF8|nr:uncharacterized protein LOC110372724 isoform X2 [Helicoverpa armigera]